MARNLKLVRALSASNVVLGFMSGILGVVSIYAAPFYDGVFGMGIWIGAWIVITGLAGYYSAKKPANFFRVGVFLGCCFVSMVTVAICSIVLGTAVITHYRLEMTVTRDYYKDKGSWGAVEHEDYWKPQEYFDERNRQGTVGCVVYGSILFIMAVDFFVCCGCCYACKDMCKDTAQAQPRSYNVHRTPTQQSQQWSQRWPQAQQQEFSELAFAASPQLMSTFSHTGEYYLPYKLPNYAELFPEGAQGAANNTDTAPPPAYSPGANQRHAPALVLIPVSGHRT